MIVCIQYQEDVRLEFTCGKHDDIKGDIPVAWLHKLEKQQSCFVGKKAGEVRELG